jgi:hypothetical protein
MALLCRQVQGCVSKYVCCRCFLWFCLQQLLHYRDMPLQRRQVQRCSRISIRY